MVNGPSPGPEPAVQARDSSSAATGRPRARKWPMKDMAPIR